MLLGEFLAGGTEIEKCALATPGCNRQTDTAAVVDEIDVQGVPHGRRNEILEKIVCLLAIDSGREESEATQNPSTVAIDRKHVPAQRIQQDAAGSLGAHARQTGQERLSIVIGKFAKRIQSDATKGVPDPLDLCSEPCKLDLCHAAGSERTDDLLRRKAQEVFPPAAHPVTKTGVYIGVRPLPRADRELDVDQFVQRLFLVSKGCSVEGSLQAVIDLRQDLGGTVLQPA